MVSTSPPFCSLYQTGAPMNFSDCSFNYLLSNPKNCELIRRLACYCTMYDLHYCVAHSAYPFFYKYSFTDPTFVNLTNEIILEDIFSNFIKIFTILQTILNYHSRIFDESSVWGLIYSFNFYLSSQISKFSQANYILNSILQTSHFPIAVDRLVTLTKNQQSLFDSYYSKVGLIFFLISRKRIFRSLDISFPDFLFLDFWFPDILFLDISFPGLFVPWISRSQLLIHYHYSRILI